MEYIVVSYPGDRDFRIDGLPMGTTNRTHTIQLMAGPHLVDLGSPENYWPRQIEVLLRDTTPDRPYIVEFATEESKTAPPGQRPYAFVAMNYAKKYLNRFFVGDEFMRF